MRSQVLRKLSVLKEAHSDLHLSESGPLTAEESVMSRNALSTLRNWWWECCTDAL